MTVFICYFDQNGGPEKVFSTEELAQEWRFDNGAMFREFVVDA